LVRETPKGPIVGSVEMSHLGLQSSGIISDVMDTRVYYVHENDTLGEALHAFYVTNQPLFMVTNSHEEFVGIITVQHIINQLLGHVPGSDFDQYADISAVAAKHHHKKPEEVPAELPAKASETISDETDDEFTVEVIE
jgi:CBS domain containing-hemolysin-like protein